MKKKKYIKKEDGKESNSQLCLAAVMFPLNKALSFESSSQQIGFSMALGRLNHVL
jgi:hypothetical protein